MNKPNAYEELKLKVDKEKENSADKTEELMKNQPTFDESVYKGLPQLLNDILKQSIHLDNPKRKDIMLLSILTSLSSLFPTVKSNYHNRTIYSNLYFFLAGKAASGKGIMRIAMDILKGYNSDLKTSNEKKTKTHECEMNEWNAFTNKEKLGKTKPTEPILKYSSMSTNITQTKFITHISNGTGLMFSTEADSMVVANKQDWGNYSSDLRAMYQHEPIIIDRVGSGRVDIEEPKLSICISGTIDQIFKVLGKSQDGLFSRFMIYNYSAERNYISGKPTEGNFIEPEILEQVKQLIYYFQTKTYEFKMTDSQWSVFDKYQKNLYEKIKLINEDDDIDSVAFRHSLMSFRIIMILSILRSVFDPALQFENIIYPLDSDIKRAINITKTLILHSSLIFNSQEKEKTYLKENKTEICIKQILKLDQFTRQELINVLKPFNVSESIMDKSLRNLIIEKYIEKLDRFTYKKKVKNGNK